MKYYIGLKGVLCGLFDSYFDTGKSRRFIKFIEGSQVMIINFLSPKFDFV